MPDLPSQEPKKNGPSAPNLSKGCLPAPPIANITTPAGIKELLDHSSVELTSVEPTVNLTLDEQRIINTIIGKATIVGMGEACHWHSHEAHQVKDKIFRYLVQEKGFRVFALEDSREACKEVDRCLKDREHNLSAKEITKKFGFRVWWTKELSSVIKFINEWNTNTPTDMISVIGIDANDLLSPVHSLKRHCESSTDELKKLLGDYEGTIRSAMEIEAAPYDQKTIEEALDSLGVPITKDSDKENTEVPKSSIPTLIKEALEEAQVNTENPDIKEALPDIKEALEELDISLSTFSKRLLNKLKQQGPLIVRNYRDEKMYKFLSDHIKNRATEKIFLWAHNYHIAKGNPAEWTPPNNSQINKGTQLKPLGQWIHEDTDLSAQYKNIGFCHNFTYMDSGNQSQNVPPQNVRPQNVPPQNVPSDSFEGLVLEYDKAAGEEKNRIINLRNDVPIPENSEDRSNKTEEPVMIALCLDYNVPNKVIRKSHAPAQLRKCLDGIIFLKNANTNNWLAQRAEEN